MSRSIAVVYLDSSSVCGFVLFTIEHRLMKKRQLMSVKDAARLQTSNLSPPIGGKAGPERTELLTKHESGLESWQITRADAITSDQAYFLLLNCSKTQLWDNTLS